MGVCQSNANSVDLSHISQHVHIAEKSHSNFDTKNEIPQTEKCKLDADEKRKNSLQTKINILTFASEKIGKYKKENGELKEINTELNDINGELKDCIDDKNIQILENETELKEMEYKIIKLESEALETKQSNSINDILYKVHGDDVNKLKYNKMHAKFVTFISGINHLFYYDEKVSKHDPKCIIVRNISISNDLIEKQVNKPWFLIIGLKRKALFITESVCTRDKWLNFINKALENNAVNSSNPYPIQTQAVLHDPSKSHKTHKSDKSETSIEQEFEYKTLKFNYPSKIAGCTILNNGHTIQININNSKCKLLLNNENEMYVLKQFDFYTPAQHSIDNKQYEMEMHLVHINQKTNKIIILCFIFTTRKKYKRPTIQLNQSKTHLILVSSSSVSYKSYKSSPLNGLNGIGTRLTSSSFFSRYAKEEKKQSDNDTDNETDDNETDLSEFEYYEHDNDFLKQFWDQIPFKKTQKEVPLNKPLNFDYLFKTATNNFTKNVKTNQVNLNMQMFEYVASLKTPPYTEGVQWLICKNTHFINYKQLAKLKKIWYNHL